MDKEALFQEESSKETLSADLAAQVIQLARNTLFVNLRFMQRALSNLEIKSYDGTHNIAFACDGRSLYYDPAYVLARYKENANIINRSMLHSLLHCVFHHDWVGKDINRPLWNLATDIAVENTINEISKVSRLNAFSIKEQAQQQVLVDTLKNELNLLNAENIYKYLIQHEISEDEATAQRELFKLDQHSLWLNASEDAIGDEAIELIRIWKDVSKRLQMELETMNSGYDLLCANLQSINRTKRNYAEFLRKFGNHGEIMRLSDDEFDNAYYSYGLELYGNIPLIENLEYREQRHIKEFVIAIDTSGSVQGDTVQKFVQRTYDLIKSQESFDLRIKLHITQCDDRIREDAVITSEDEFDKYIRQMQILGLGETDFRPVFEYVDKLIEERKLTNLAGLLYFTDGQGTFPAKKPSYDTAFIIHSDEVYPPEVPSWAMRLILEEDFR